MDMDMETVLPPPASVIVKNYIRKSPAYAALDEYIRWDSSNTRFENLLEHLNHVYVNHGRGRSILDLIFEMVSLKWEDIGAGLTLAEPGNMSSMPASG